MNEKIYTTPRTYGNATGYDIELSHYPSLEARISEKIAYQICRSGLVGSMTAGQVAKTACDIAGALCMEWERRSLLIATEPAPDLDPNYGKRKPSGSEKPDA